MRENKLLTLWREGKPAINAWLSIGNGYSAEILASGGYDAVLVDLQHGMFDFSDAVTMLTAISTQAAVPIARVPGNDLPMINKVLDAGAYGIICPMIESAADAKRLVDACRYPPQGGRSFGPARGITYGGADYFSHANANILVLGMIETPKGVAAIDEILAVPGLDGIYIGPNDLALTMGHAPGVEPFVPPVARTIDMLLAKTKAARKYAGIFCITLEEASRAIASGFNLVTPGNDAGMLRAEMARRLSILRESPIKPSAAY